MLATWTRSVPCAPHDHGGSKGAMRVLRGEAIHFMWKVEAGQLVLAAEERLSTGAVVTFGPDLVHSMADAGKDRNLVTLHFYAGPIDYMVVYDVDATRTLIVEGRCGAWVPRDPLLIRKEFPGILPVHEVLASPAT